MKLSAIKYSILIQGFGCKNIKCAATMARTVLQPQVFSMYGTYPKYSGDVRGRGEIGGAAQSRCGGEMVTGWSAWACRDYGLLVFVAGKSN